MKITAQEEYGLRILLRIAKATANGDACSGVCIANISDLEGMSHHNTAKICRILRVSGYIESSLGHTGGYKLAKSPEEINLGGLMRSLGGTIYDENFCSKFTPDSNICSNSMDCSIRSVWKLLQEGIDTILEKLTLADLMGGEQKAKEICSDI